MNMLQPQQMHEYQDRAVDHSIEHMGAALHLDPGLGKTVIVLTAINILMYDMFAVKGVLIAAPLRVVQSVWRQEAAKWSHTKDLTFSYITGDPSSRVRGLCTKADIYLINYENLAWLQTQVEHRFLSLKKYPPWDMFVFDESSKMKNTRIRQGVKRGTAALKLLQYCPRRLNLTGSPAPNGMLDLFGQYLCLDGGVRLGQSHDAFRSMYFYLSSQYSTKWLAFEQSKAQITEKLADITMDLVASDYITMPEEIVNDIMLTFEPALQRKYDAIEREMLVELDSGHEVAIFNRASLVNRTLQYAGGGIYLNPGMPEWEMIHNVKMDALIDLVDELLGQPVLLLYQYQHEAKRIEKQFPDAKWISSKTSDGDFNQAIIDWNTGKLQMIIAHPASMGHGVDRLQSACHNVIWFGLNWSYELYYQSNSRIARQGQSSPTVMIHRILVDNTTDLIVRMALETKKSTESEVRELIRAYGKQKRGMI
jgi:SNF2 family DNA or RNA helicase